MTQGPVRVHVDFNEYDDDGTMTWHSSNADRPEDLAPGVQVLLHDGEGNEMMATVQRFWEPPAGRQMVVFEPIVGTWKGAGE